MKYMVSVNNKWMVSVEANSACGAEHVILDTFACEINKFKVITGAQAFDSEAMKTEYFMNLLMNCETIDMSGLTQKISHIAELFLVVEEQAKDADRLESELKELEEQVEKLSEKRDALYRALKAERIGQQRSECRANEALAKMF